MAQSEENSLADIKRFLTTPENPISSSEMMEFWSSLTDEEKAEFKKTPLPKSENE